MAGSSHANLFATISAGIGALWGPKHGGANQAVIEMLQGIQDDGGDLQDDGEGLEEEDQEYNYGVIDKKMSITKLRSICKELGLPLSGNKSKLISRINEKLN